MLYKLAYYMFCVVYLTTAIILLNSKIHKMRDLICLPWNVKMPIGAIKKYFAAKNI